MSSLILSNEAKTISGTGAQPTEVKAPPSTLITPPSSLNTEVDGQTTLYPVSTPSTSPAPSTALPVGYLSGGTMLDKDGVLRPEYLKEYAQQVADLLKPLSASTFKAAFLKEAKPARKKSVSYGAKKTCTNGMAVGARTLVGLKKAPAILLSMIEAVTDTVQDAATFDALYLHLKAVYSYLLAYEGGDRL